MSQLENADLRPAPRASAGPTMTAQATNAAVVTTPTGRRPGRPRGGRVLADRAQLLEAAERLIRAEGADVTMQAIAAEATVTKPILYRSVGDKDALVAALAERLVDRINAAAAAAMAKASSPRDGLRGLVGACMDVVDADPNLYLFVTAGGSNDDRLSQALRLADRSAVPMAAQLAAQRAAAGLDPRVALTWAYGVIGALQLVSLWWLRDRSSSSDELADRLTELLWSGLGGEAPVGAGGGGPEPTRPVRHKRAG